MLGESVDESFQSQSTSGDELSFLAAQILFRRRHFHLRCSNLQFKSVHRNSITFRKICSRQNPLIGQSFKVTEAPNHVLIKLVLSQSD